MTEDVRPRIRCAIRSEEPAPRSDAFNELLTDACARMLTLETERLRLSRRVSEVAASSDDAGAVAELRRLWLRRRAIAGELRELRDLLRELSPRRTREPA